VPLNPEVRIIGSLLWDSKRGRPAWREVRLDLDSAQSVTAPIRYGHVPGKGRGYTYTVVFSRLSGIGHAKVVLCSRPIAARFQLAWRERLLNPVEKSGDSVSEDGE
jgi:hypothetical protein